MRIDILGTKFDAITREEAEIKIGQFLEDGSSKKYLIATPNTEFITVALKNPAFKKILNKEVALSLPDGMGPIWAAKFMSLKSPTVPVLREIVIFLEWLFTILLIPFAPSFFKKPFPEKISGADFIKNIAKVAETKKKEVFLLGGGPTVAERAALQLQTEFIDLKVAGVNSSRAEEKEAIVDSINKSKADILLVAFGAPKQEIWLSENLKKTNCKIGVGLGGSFDFLAGIKKRSPQWMQKAGLEWLYRLIIEPRRIWRQLSIPYFMFLVLIEKEKHGK